MKNVFRCLDYLSALLEYDLFPLSQEQTISLRLDVKFSCEETITPYISPVSPSILQCPPEV